MSTTRSADTLDLHTSEYVLPKPPRGPGEVLVVQPPGSAQGSNHRRAEAARGLGDRFLALAECQQQFLGELRQRLLALDTAIAEDSRARLKGSLRAALDVLDWCDVVQVDLQREGQMATAGWLPHDLAEFCREVAVAGAPEGTNVLVSGQAPRAWWGDGVLLADAVQAALALVAERTSARGSICLEVGGEAERAWVRIAGTGDAVEQVEAGSVRRFRNAVAHLGARVVPDQLGPSAPGLVLHLPPTAG